MKALVGEVSALVQSRHRNIVNLLAFKLEASTSHLKAILAFEYAHNGDLHTFLTKCNHLDEKITRFILAKIVLALSYLHKRSFVHRDIKPENILLDFNYQPKISDFGLCIDSDLNHKSVAGTRSYMAPEAHKGSYSAASDMFSVGIVAWVMLIGEYGNKKFNKKPFKIERQGIHLETGYRLYQKIHDKEFGEYCKLVMNHLKQQKMSYRNLSPQFYKWFVKMVQYDPKARPNHKQILNSEWMRMREGGYYYNKYLLRNDMKRIDDGCKDDLIEYSGSVDFDQLFTTNEKLDVNSICMQNPFVIINEIISSESKIDSDLDVCEEIKRKFESKFGYNMDLVENDNNNYNMYHGIDVDCVNRRFAIMSNNDFICDESEIEYDGLLLICICAQNKGIAEQYIVDKNGKNIYLTELFNDYFNDKPKICIFQGLQPLDTKSDDESMSTNTSARQSSSPSTSTSDPYAHAPPQVLSIDNCIRFYCDGVSDVLTIVNDVLCQALSSNQASLKNVLNIYKQRAMKYPCVYENRKVLNIVGRA